MFVALLSHISKGLVIAQPAMMFIETLDNS